MREQVIASRGGRRSSVPARGFAQRPARRGNGSEGGTRFSLRAVFGYLPLALKFVLALLVMITLIIGYRVAASASMFQVRNIDISGSSRVSADEIEAVTRKAVARTGVWRANLSAISAEIQKLPGVRRATVTRVLPDRLRVRVMERVPLAVVRTNSGHFVWVDEEAVAMGEMKSADREPSFFIRGWNEDETEDARRENVERIQKYLEAAREWEAVGLSARVSEINLHDVRDVRAQLTGNDSQIEVRLGTQDFGNRLKRAFEVLDDIRNTPRGPFVTYVDFQAGRIVVGFSSGNKLSAGSTDSSSESDASQNNLSTTGISTTAKKDASAPAAAPQGRTSADKKPESSTHIRIR
jgi:cell division protein FtsQ